MTILPPLDVHAHIDVDIAGHELLDLGAVVLAMTRSLDEATEATVRTDDYVVWGVGCHPGLSKAQSAFDPDRFSSLLDLTPIAGELGLDAKSSVPIERQRTTFRSALAVLAQKPRVTSLHSAGATGEVLDELEREPIQGAILHWWLGSTDETERALSLGCYVSSNAAGIRRRGIPRGVPLDRLLAETDHPFGDRGARPHRPGNITQVETALVDEFGGTPEDVRRRIWRNLAQLVSDTGSGRLIPAKVRTLLATV